VESRILIVDDSEPFLVVARRVLERDGLAVVGTASTAAQAMAQVASQHPRVVLVDVNLGDESGFDLARRLAASSDVPAGTSVILMSTHDDLEYADLLARAPVQGFIAKERLSGSSIRAILLE
jgi:two-component system, NarL family, nitrate/nitrite response regulator NarL